MFGVEPRPEGTSGEVDASSMKEQLERWKRLRRIAVDHRWKWDAYGVGEDRRFAPTSFDIDGLLADAGRAEEP